MTFKAAPKPGAPVFVVPYTRAVDAYRGSFLVQARFPGRPRIVAIVDEAWERTEAPPRGEIDEQWIRFIGGAVCVLCG